MKSGRALAGAAVLFRGHAYRIRDHHKLKPAALAAPRFVVVGDFDWDGADMDRLMTDLSVPQERNGPRAGG